MFPGVFEAFPVRRAPEFECEEIAWIQTISYTSCVIIFREGANNAAPICGLYVLEAMHADELRAAIAWISGRLEAQGWCRLNDDFFNVFVRELTLEGVEMRYGRGVN